MSPASVYTEPKLSTLLSNSERKLRDSNSMGLAGGIQRGNGFIYALINPAIMKFIFGLYFILINV